MHLVAGGAQPVGGGVHRGPQPVGGVEQDDRHRAAFVRGLLVCWSAGLLVFIVFGSFWVPPGYATMVPGGVREPHIAKEPRWSGYGQRAATRGRRRSGRRAVADRRLGRRPVAASVDGRHPETPLWGLLRRCGSRSRWCSAPRCCAAATTRPPGRRTPSDSARPCAGADRRVGPGWWCGSPPRSSTPRTPATPPPRATSPKIRRLRTQLTLIQRVFTAIVGVIAVAVDALHLPRHAYRRGLDAGLSGHHRHRRRRGRPVHAGQSLRRVADRLRRHGADRRHRGGGRRVGCGRGDHPDLPERAHLGRAADHDAGVVLHQQAVRELVARRRRG